MAVQSGTGNGGLRRAKSFDERKTEFRGSTRFWQLCLGGSGTANADTNPVFLSSNGYGTRARAGEIGDGNLRIKFEAVATSETIGPARAASLHCLIKPRTKMTSP